jgi:CRISPR-associated protein Csm4
MRGRLFKNPILLARSGSVFSTADAAGLSGRHAAFIGQGLGGEGQLSLAQPATVSQGYAPAIRIDLRPALARLHQPTGTQEENA